VIFLLNYEVVLGFDLELGRFQAMLFSDGESFKTS